MPPPFGDQNGLRMNFQGYHIRFHIILSIISSSSALFYLTLFYYSPCRLAQSLPVQLQSTRPPAFARDCYRPKCLTTESHRREGTVMITQIIIKIIFIEETFSQKEVYKKDHKHLVSNRIFPGFQESKSPPVLYSLPLTYHLLQRWRILASAYHKLARTFFFFVCVVLSL